MKALLHRMAACLLLAAFLCSPVARAQASDEQVQQLADYVVQALPFGEMFQLFVDKDPQWPLGPKASRVPREQLECLRARLSTEGFRQQRRAETLAFARRYPDKVEDSVRVLRDGAAALFGASIQAGIEKQRTGKAEDFSVVASRFTPMQLAAFLELTSDEKHKELRSLIGIDDAIGLQKTPEQNEASGRNKGALVGMKLMLSAMDYCKVPLAAVQ